MATAIVEGRFERHAAASGDESLVVTEPSPVRLRPADLVA